jgi:thiol-disulfide isomerase/thioredoxin/Flp pilus assembly protein TadD
VSPLVLGWAAAVALASPAAVRDCLDRLDPDCAERALRVDDPDDSSDPAVLRALAETRFHQGRYPEAHAAMKRAVELGDGDRWDDLALYERTMYATANWVEEARGRFAVRWRPGVDAILVDEAFRAIEGSDRHIAPLLGGSLPAVTRVELYPDGRSFSAASSLFREDVETTGVVGLAKWGRLLVTSPRALARGYGWQDTVAHEYVHLVVAHQTADRAPVWLQEAIAKYLEPRWREGVDAFALTVRQKGLLAEAIARDDLVSFEEMHPSLAKLPTAERAALAYAQLATLMQYCFQLGGDDVLVRTLPAVREGTDPRDALAAAAGAADFPTLLGQWKAWLVAQSLEGEVIDELPVVLDGGEDLDLDPVLAEREDLARFVKLGDLLREHGRPDAALVEYAKAVPEDEPPSPLLSNRLAQAHLALGHLLDARRLLEASLVDYPEFALSHKTLGQIQLRMGASIDAARSLRASLEISPFDPEARQELVTALQASGRAAEAAEQERLLAIRARGGDDVEREPIHTVVGEYEAPSNRAAREKSEAAREAWPGRPAPAWIGVEGLDGSPLRATDFAGKVLLVDFWATWCGPCKVMMPHLSAVQDANAGRVQVVGLSSETPSKIKAFLAQKPVSYVVGVDVEGRTNGAHGVDSLPTLFVIGRDGNVVDVIVGAGESATSRIDAAVKKALEAP